MKMIFLQMLLFFYGWNAFSLAQNYLAFPPDWFDPKVEGGGVKAVVTDVVYDGARAQALKLISTGSQIPAAKNTEDAQVITQKVSLSLADFQTLSFKAKFEGATAKDRKFKIRISGRGLNIVREFSESEGTPEKEGYRSFSWDLNLKQGADVMEFIRLSANGLTSQNAEPLCITIIDFICKRTGPEKKSEARTPSRLNEWETTDEKKVLDVSLSAWTTDHPIQNNEVKIEPIHTTQAGQEVPALRITYRQGKEFNVISLPVSINTEEFNTLTFRAKIEVPSGSKVLGNVEAPLTGWFSYQFNQFFDNFGVALEGPNNVPWTIKGVPSTHFLQHLDKSQNDNNGFRTFRWDIKNENPTGNKGFDREHVEFLKIFYDNKKIPPGEKVVITITQPQFIQGLRHPAGDEARYEIFRKAMENYAPDYSDSTKYLSAPEQGRLPTPLVLVKDGKAQGEIVGKSSVWTPEGNAVNELYRWIYQLTGGSRVPVLDKPSKEERVRIYVGSAFAKKHFSEDLEALKDSDGCAIRTRGKDVYIFGATGKGTLNGVYTFLEGNSDIIWPRSSDYLGAVYTESPDFSIIWGDYSHRPRAHYWGWMGKTQGPSFDYQIRNRANYLGLRSAVDFKYWGLFKEEGGGHNLHSWIPFSLWETHPEYWALIDGERQFPNGYKNQICLTNHDGQAIFTERILQVIRENPQMKIADCMNIKTEDNWGSCECEECMRPIRLPDGSILENTDIAFRSTQFFIFLNSVAQAIHNQGFPNLQIGTYIYFFTVPIPKVPITSFLRPYFCDYVRKDYKVPIFAPINAIWWDTLQEWTKISDKVVMREYTGLYVYFRPMAEVAAYDIQAELDVGTFQFTSESLPPDSSDMPVSVSPASADYDVSFMEYWMILRLYWEPEADVEQLRKYFIRRTFREAAPEMEHFYGTIRSLYFKEKRTSDFEENQETLRLVLRLGKAKELRGYLTEALRKVKHPASKIMITSIAENYDRWISELQSEHQ